jgi:hypothetical protein
MLLLWEKASEIYFENDMLQRFWILYPLIYSNITWLWKNICKTQSAYIILQFERTPFKI